MSWGDVMMKINGGQEALLDRGGRPTLRELLAHLVFSPVNGVLRLGNTRMVLQRTSFLSHLREEIVRNYGREDAFVLLTRLGFQAGVEDSRFVQASWPNLDPGDAFTAGTRLHTVSGVTRVETVHNDFDFKKGKFSGEFLWHESAEASEHRKHYGDAIEPVCWSLVGYASGYATHALGKLIVYKETECKAMGHKHCRVIGKPAEVWGEDDPTVQLFRRQIMPRYLGEEIRARPPQASPRPVPTDGTARLEAIVVEPVRVQLERIATSSLPALMSGPVGSGKLIAASYLAKLAAPGTHALDFVPGHGLTQEKLLALLAPSTSRSGTRRVIVLQNPEMLDAGVQVLLENHLRTTMDGSRHAPLLILLTELSPAAFSADSRLRPALRCILLSVQIVMPSLSQRRSDIAEIARSLAENISARVHVPVRELSPGATGFLSDLPLRENLVCLESILTKAILEASPLQQIDAASIEKAWAELRVDTTIPDKTESLKIAALLALDAEGFEIERLNDMLYALAMERAEGNVARAAQLLGLTRPQLAYRLHAMKSQI
jgi:transcriptional regulator with AAA-type ATPase domain